MEVGEEAEEEEVEGVMCPFVKGCGSGVWPFS